MKKTVITKAYIAKHTAVAANGCWVWQATVSEHGYAVVNHAYVHRASHELFKGNIPDGMQIDHLCRNRRCVNPDHLEAVTQRTNLLRGESRPAANHRKTHCVRGHELSGDNIVRLASRPTERPCKVCWYERNRLYKRAARSAAKAAFSR